MDFAAASPSASSGSEQNSSRRTSTSPRLMTSDLGLDPTDPLNLLLHNSSQSGISSGDSSMEDSSQGGSPPDWSQLSLLWPSTNFENPGESKDFSSEFMDFNMLTMDNMEFNSSMSLEPNSFHLDNKPMNYTYDDSFSLHNELQPGQHFPFTFQSTPSLLSESSTSSPQQRRSSITSSSSSSGASLSPVMAPNTAVHPQSLAQDQASASAPISDPAAELAQRVRETAGVMLAVPMSANIPGHGQGQNSAMSLFTSNILSRPNLMTSPLTIPTSSYDSMRSSTSSASSAASTPPPSTPPPPSATYSNSNFASTSSINVAAPPGTMGLIGRPKTSHTTIERRYRTNLNARIQSLRMAVPALRVLEDREGGAVGVGGGRKVKVKIPTGKVFSGKVKKEGDKEEEIVDIVDERGFVDGVKVARKCSKANVLGKAVEYIRVLKKREGRLKREQSGLKSLLGGLVGGPALLREWEREWKEKFGGEEKDEVEGDDLDDGDGGSDEDEDDDDDDEGRKKKKVKVDKPKKESAKKIAIQTAGQQAQQVPGQVGEGGLVVPEKRKRGRPRKSAPPPPPPVTVTPIQPALSSSSSFPVVHEGDQVMTYMRPQDLEQPRAAAPQQYLLATFALFSFFNSPLTSSSSSRTYTNTHSQASPHAHTGTVLSHAPVHVVQHGWGWRETIQAFHLLVTVLVFLSIVCPWILPKRLLPLSFSSLFQKSTPVSARASTTTQRPSLRSTAPRSRSATLVAALSHERRGTSGEVAGLRSALGLDLGLIQSLLSQWKRDAKDVGFEQRGLEQRTWVRLGEICVLGDEPVSTWTRIQTFWHMRTHLSWFTCSAADLSTLALVVYPLGRLARGRAEAFWDAAKGRKGVSGLREGGVGVQVRPHERLVLENMGVQEAARRLIAQRNENGARWEAERERYSPIGVIACTLVRERVKRHLEMLFVKTVLPEELEVIGALNGISNVGTDAEEKEDEERRKTVDAARSLGGKMGELGDILERVWTTGITDFEEVAPMLSLSSEDDVDQDVLEGEIKSLLTALVLYRRIFPSSILGSACGHGNGSGVSILLSPPPSPSRKDIKLHYSLRRALGSRVFDVEGGELASALEDARDRVVDMLVDSRPSRQD